MTPKRPIVLKVANVWTDEPEEPPSQTEIPPLGADLPARKPLGEPKPKRGASEKPSGSSGGTKAKVSTEQ